MPRLSSFTCNASVIVLHSKHVCCGSNNGLIDIMFPFQFQLSKVSVSWGRVCWESGAYHVSNQPNPIHICLYMQTIPGVWSNMCQNDQIQKNGCTLCLYSCTAVQCTLCTHHITFQRQSMKYSSVKWPPGLISFHFMRKPRAAWAIETTNCPPHYLLLGKLNSQIETNFKMGCEFRR